MHASEARTHGSIGETLEAIPGVDRAIGTDSGGYWLICASPVDHALVLEQALEVLRSHSADPEQTPIEIVTPALRGERRVRFDRVERILEANQAVRVGVHLEWNGNRYTGEAVGERGETLELRTAAMAAVAAVENVTGERLGLRLVGVKQVRAFDAELVVVSLYGTSSRQRLLGAVLAGNEPLRATAQAVLSCLNRILGNYLQRR